MTTARGFTLNVTWRGRTYNVATQSSDPALEEMGRAVAEATGAAYDTLKLLVTGKKRTLAPAQETALRASEAGLTSGFKALLLASLPSEVQAVRQAVDLPGLRGFDDELRRAARRRRTAGAGTRTQPPKAEYSFGAYEAWQLPGLQPPPSEALKLLYRLASDPGILGVMASHQYKVGKLSEMPPEGKVGVSPVCILGVNINAGQEISLRLRTDDLRGFRKYDRIRETLIHELAHMEYGEHDNDFKQLNSELRKECDAINARYGTAQVLAGDAFGLDGDDGWRRTSELDDERLLYDEDDVMAATARLSGRTLRQLAGQGGAPIAAAARGGGTPAAPPRAAAAEAALLRMQRLQQQQQEHQQQEQQQSRGYRSGQGSELPVQVDVRGDGDLLEKGPQQEQDQHGTDFARSSGSGGGASDADVAMDGAADGDAAEEARLREYEHYDPRTEAAEAAAERLGSLQEPPGSPPSPPAPSGQQGEQRGVSEHVEQAGGTGLEGACGQQLGGGEDVGAAGGQQAAEGGDGEPMDVDGEGERGVAAGAVRSGASNGDLEGRADKPHAADGGTAAVGMHAGATQAPLVLAPPAEALGSAGGEEAGAGGGGADDPAVGRVRKAWAAVQDMVCAAGGQRATHSATTAGTPHIHPQQDINVAGRQLTPVAVLEALETVQTILGNAARAPAEDKYRRVRLGNAAFQRKVGNVPGGLELLRLAGFAEVGEAAGAAGEGRVMRLRRNDPGLLWLVVSVVGDALEQLRPQVAGA